MNLKHNNKLILFSVLSIVTVFILSFILKGYVPLPEDSHYFASHFSQPESFDIIRHIYNFINTPSTIFLSNLYDFPFWYGLATYTAEISFGLLLLYIVQREVENLFVATVTVIVFSPLFLGVAHYILTLGYSSGPILDIFFIKPIVFDLGTLNLTPRLIFAFFFAATIHFFINQKYLPLCIFIILMLISHVNKGILSSGIILLATIILMANRKVSYQKPLLIFGAILVGIAPLLYKLALFPDTGEVISNSVWYHNMIRDEADDFSYLWVFSDFLNALVTYCLFWALTIFLYYRLVSKSFWLTPVFLITFIPQSLFFLLGALELVSVYTDNFVFIRPVISLSANLNILGYAFIPGLIIWAKILASLLPLKQDFKLPLQLTFGSLFGLLLLITSVFAESSGFNKKLNYFKIAFQAEKIERYTDIMNLNNLFRPYYTDIYEIPQSMETYYKGYNVFMLDEDNETHPPLIPDNNYDTQYGKVAVLESLVSSIITNVDPNNGIIVPPYLSKLRVTLPEYNIYFLEMHDGNLMLGSGRFAAILLARMQSLLGHTYTDLPSRSSGYQQSFIRKSYLSVTESRLRALSAEYTEYSIFITETSHELDFPVLYSDENYIFYSLK